MSTNPMIESSTAAPPTPPARREVRIYSHSTLLYWWPVWATGYLMALITFVDNSRMAIVPSGTVAKRKALVRDNADTNETHERDILELPTGKSLYPIDGTPENPYVHMSRQTKLGVCFSIVLLLVIVISNVPLRGLMSVVVILGIVLISVIFSLLGLWESIGGYFQLLQIHINAAGYLFIAIALSIIWALAVFLFDKRDYVVVTPGEVRICLTFEGGETAYDATGVKFSKRQTDFFRRILGLNAGDLIINPSNHPEIDLPNVVNVGGKLQKIEELLRERKVV